MEQIKEQETFGYPSIGEMAAYMEEENCEHDIKVELVNKPFDMSRVIKLD